MSFITFWNPSILILHTEEFNVDSNLSGENYCPNSAIVFLRLSWFRLISFNLEIVSNSGISLGMISRLKALIVLCRGILDSGSIVSLMHLCALSLVLGIYSVDVAISCLLSMSV